MPLKTFLFLYPERPTRRVLAAHRAWLDERDIRLVLADESPEADDELLLPRYTDVDEAVRVVEQFARTTPIDALVVQTEYGLMPGAILGDRLGLPSLRPETVMRCANRWRFREALKNETQQPRYALASSVADVRRFGPFPVILKGMASTMSRAVVKAENPEDVEKFIARLADLPDIVRLQKFAALAKLDLGADPTRQFLVEEFVDGVPREVDGLAYEMIVDPFGAVEQIPSRAGFYIEGYRFDPDRLSTVLPRTLEIAFALDLDPCGFSIEFRGDAVIEVNPRLGEDDGLPDFYNALRGEHPILDWIEYLNENQQDPCEADEPVAIAYASCYTGGTVREVPAAEGVEVVVKPGDVLLAPPHPDFAPHLAYAIRTGPNAYAEARAAVDSLLFLIE